MTADATLNISIVDDDDAVRYSLRMLVQVFGWQLREFATGEAFLASLPAHRPDCVLLDLNMPGMGGVEVLKVLAKDHPALPVVVVSGELEGSPTLARARAAGAREFVGKPFRDEELRAAIERSIRA